MTPLSAGGHVVNQMNTDVVWKKVVGWPDYEVSNTGHVRSLNRLSANGSKLRGKRLAPNTSPAGHQYVTLYREHVKTKRSIHRVVLEAFVGPRPDGMETCHGDGNPANNRVENLRWDTHSENTKDRVRHGTHHEKAKVRCKRGHVFFRENLVPSSRDGARVCLTCQRARAAAARYGTDIADEGSVYYLALLESAVEVVR